MYITINSASEFMDEFNRMGRGDQFTYDALESLWHYYNELDDYELDVIGICCEWFEYESEEETLAACGVESVMDIPCAITLDNGNILVQMM